MKKKNLLSTLLITLSFILLGGEAELMGQSSDYCTYGDASTAKSAYYSPYGGGSSNYEYYVYLYEAANVNFDGIITHIAFKGAEDVAASDNVHHTIYIKDVPSGTTLSSSTTFATYVNGSTCVWPRTSTPAITDGSWNTIELERSFEHAMGNSMLVIVNTDGKTPRHSVYYVNSSNHIWYKQGSTDPGVNVAGALGYALPAIKLTYNPVACPKPTVLTASNITKNSATLGWTSDAESFNLQYKTTDAESWTTVENISTNSYTLDGVLSPKTTYQFKVQAVCSGTPGSYSNPVSFTTSCELPYTMGFEDSEIDEFNALWEVKTNNANTGKKDSAKRTDSYGFQFAYENANQYLITPLLEATGGSISFYHKKYGSSERSFKVGYSTTTNEISSFTWDASSTSAIKDEWNEYSNTFPVSTKYIAIASDPNTGSYGCYIYIDDIAINAPSEINRPTNLSVSDVTYNSAQFNWTAGGSETSWKLQYKSTASAVWTTVDVSSKPHTINTLNGSTTYEWRVAAYIAPNMSDYEQGTSFSTPAQYPAPTGLTTSNIKTSGASFTWDETTGADGYNLRYSVSSPESWTTVNGLTEETYTISSGLTGNTTYKVQVQAIYGGSPSAWTEYSFTTLPLKIFNNSKYYWDSSLPWSPSGVPTANHDVQISENATVGISQTGYANNITIDEDKTLTIRNTGLLICNNITNNGTLIMEDGGQLICNNQVSVKAKKSIEGWTVLNNNSGYLTDGWYFIASPLSEPYTPAAPMTSNTYDLYRLNPSTSKWENIKNTSHTDFTTLTNGRGYLYANSNTIDLEFTGTIKAYEASHDMTIDNGLNLIGNPFTYTTYVNCPFYRMNSAKNAVEGVEEYWLNSIAPCTGIIVEADGESTVTFSKDEPAHSSAAKGNIQMVLSQTVNHRGTSTTETLDNAIVSFNEGTELGKFYFGMQNANIYIPQNGKEFAIVSAGQEGQIPLNFRARVNGQYTLTFSSPLTSNLSSLTLIDNLTGAHVDLLQTPSYTFQGNTTDISARFRLLFTTTGVDENDDESQTDFAFISDGQLIVNGTGTLYVYDALGRQVSAKQVTPLTSHLLPLTSGVYVLQLVEGNNVRTQKIIVK